MARNNEKIDIVLLISAGLIILLGFIVFTSVSMARIAATTENIEDLNLPYFLIRQFVMGVLPGVLIGFLLYKIPLEIIKKWAPFVLLLNIIGVAMVFIPGLGLTVRGATRWISIGGISFQPSEFLKLTFIIYLASWLSSRRDIDSDKQVFSETFIAFGAVCAFISGLILLQSDLSTLIVIMASSFVMYFTYRTPFSHILALTVSGFTALVASIVLFPYRLARVKDMLSAGVDTQDMSYQAHQALIAIGSGGITGLGFGVGHQKYGFLPFAMSDSIFAAYAEEAGFIGSALLIILFLVFAWRGVKIAKRNKDSFFSLIAIGISSWIFFQAFIHIGSMSGILPITGIPLPFISHGRAHFVAELAGLGVLLNISKS
ncbi:MAG: FtsW/RodA/SpoVE family cell cycle protein [Patescibacteria group bacterium]